jgi:glucuronokinase
MLLAREGPEKTACGSTGTLRSPFVGRNAAGATGTAFARAGLLGNPSDAYGGKTIAFSVRNFSARVSVEPSDRLEIEDRLAAPLLTAALRRFEFHIGNTIAPMRISLETDVPFQVGLAGSSAIVIAALRALSVVHARPLDPFDQSELALAAEVDELGIAAGPMDRVIQAYEGLLQMDFSKKRTPACYTRLSASSLPPLLIAWDPGGAETSDSVHSDLRDRWQRGESDVREAMALFSEIVDDGESALRDGDFARLRRAVNRNFETRAQLFTIADRDRDMVELARSHGGAAKQCGSGGACLIVLAAESDAEVLATAYRGAGYRTVRPVVEHD